MKDGRANAKAIRLAKKVRNRRRYQKRFKQGPYKAAV